MAKVGIPEKTWLELGGMGEFVAAAKEEKEVVEAMMVLLAIVLEVTEGVIVPSGRSIDEVVIAKHGHVVIVSMTVAVTVAV